MSEAEFESVADFWAHQCAHAEGSVSLAADAHRPELVEQAHRWALISKAEFERHGGDEKLLQAVRAKFAPRIAAVRERRRKP